MTIQILDLLVSSVGILLLFALWSLLFRPLAVAHLRQDLFDARDFLFDLVADGKTSLNFESAVYRGTREDINGMIRFSHGISLGTALFAKLLIPRRRQQRYRESVATLRKDLNEEERRVIRLIDEKQRLALLRFLLRSSPFMWVIAYLVGSIMMVVVCLRVLRGGVKALRLGVKACRSTFAACVAKSKNILWGPTIESFEYQSGQKYLFGSPREPCLD